MREKPRRRGLVVVRNNRKRAIRSCFGGVPHKIECFVCRVGAGPCDDANPPARGLDHQRIHLPVFIMGKRRGLTGRAAGNQAICPFLHMIVDQPLQALGVDLPILKRCHQSDIRTFKHLCLPFLLWEQWPSANGRQTPAKTTGGRSPEVWRPSGDRAEGGTLP